MITEIINVNQFGITFKTATPKMNMAYRRGMVIFALEEIEEMVATGKMSAEDAADDLNDLEMELAELNKELGIA